MRHAHSLGPLVCGPRTERQSANASRTRARASPALWLGTLPLERASLLLFVEVRSCFRDLVAMGKEPTVSPAAMSHKEEGNRLFGMGKYSAAIEASLTDFSFFRKCVLDASTAELSAAV